MPCRAGVVIDGRPTAPCEVDPLVEEDARVVLRVVLQEGRNRQIRKMCEAVGLEVTRLKRTAVGSLTLGMLPQGKWRELTEQEVRSLISEIRRTHSHQAKREVCEKTFASGIFFLLFETF